MRVLTVDHLRVVDHAPSIVLIVVALVVATVVRNVVTALLRRAHLDERLTHDPSKPAHLVKPLGDLSYFLVILLFLPASSFWPSSRCGCCTKRRNITMPGGQKV